MKNLILVIGIIILLSCGNNNEEKYISNYQEKKLSFSPLRFGFDKSNKWIKKPKNILMLHETFKKIGYQKLMNEDTWISDWNWFLDVSKSPKNLIDSLEMTYSDLEDAPKYYREFWERRKVEKNHKTVYQVVREIKYIMIDSVELEFNNEVVNDTLANLISFEYPQREWSNEESNSVLNYLIKIGLHQSAYNLISGENTRFWGVNGSKPNQEKLKELIESKSYHRPWFEDNTP